MVQLPDILLHFCSSVSQATASDPQSGLCWLFLKSRLKTKGDQAFRVRAPWLWNSLLDLMLAESESPLKSHFKNLHKKNKCLLLMLSHSFISICFICIIYMFSCIIKCQTLPELQLTSSNCFLCLTKSPKLFILP